MKDIYNQLKNTKEGEYKFIMTASGQNHFPYTEDKYEKYDISVKNTEYSKNFDAINVANDFDNFVKNEVLNED